MERATESGELLFAVFTGHCRLRLHHVEGVVRAWHDVQLTGHSRGGEPLGVGDILVVEQVVGADADPGRGDPGEVLVARGRGQRRKVGKPTIYRRWPSKAAIVAEAVLSGRLTLHSDSLEDTGDLVADLHRWLDEQFRRLEDPAAVALVQGLAAAATDGGEASERLYERITSPGRHLLRRRLEAAAQRGQIRVDVDTNAVVDAITGALLYQALIPASARPDSGAGGLLDLLLNGMRPQKDEALSQTRPVAPFRG